MRSSPAVQEFEESDSKFNQSMILRDGLRHAIFGLSSETGEVAEMISRKDTDETHLLKELGDCLWMITEACWALGIDLDGLIEEELTVQQAALNLTAQAGKVAGIMQKVYQGHGDPLDDEDGLEARQKLIWGLADCLRALMVACLTINADLDDLMDLNIEKLEKRYPDGFETERSLHREEGDI